jgi:succinyl-CoA:(S)-malate CoA-transferase subunit A/succinyl-CoA:(S)-malate CoA-transferase subunit B
MTDRSHQDTGGLPERPLAGVRVLDIAVFLAAPLCASIMGEFGAEVIKIEQPSGDTMRKFGTPTPRDGDTLAWLSEARNKQSMTLDLRHAEGKALFLRLVAKADVVCENFRPGTLEKWGLGWDVLSAANPRLVMLRVSGYGQTGPYRERPGFARVAHAFGGLSYLAGEPGGTPVVPGSTSLADYMSGLYGAIGVLMALRARDRDGVGQQIDLALYESVFRALDEMAPAYAKHGFIRERMGAATVNVCPHSHYPTKDGKWVAIACTTDRMFHRFAAVMGKPELATPERWANAPARLAVQKEVDALVTEWTRAHTLDEVIQACVAGEVPCGPLNSVADLFADPHIAARGNLARVNEPGVGEVVIPNVLPKLLRTPGRIDSLGPRLGGATETVLQGWLGLSAAEIAGLRQRRVI